MDCKNSDHNYMITAFPPLPPPNPQLDNVTTPTKPHINQLSAGFHKRHAGALSLYMAESKVATSSGCKQLVATSSSCNQLVAQHRFELPSCDQQISDQLLCTHWHAGASIFAANPRGIVCTVFSRLLVAIELSDLCQNILVFLRLSISAPNWDIF